MKADLKYEYAVQCPKCSEVDLAEFGDDSVSCRKCGFSAWSLREFSWIMRLWPRDDPGPPPFAPDPWSDMTYREQKALHNARYPGRMAVRSGSSPAQT